MSTQSDLTPQIRGLIPCDISIYGCVLSVTYRTPHGVDLDPFRIAAYANALGMSGFQIKSMMTKTRPVQVILSVEFKCEKRL